MQSLDRHRLSNGLQSALLITAMAAVLAAVGWALGGTFMALWALASGVLLLVVAPRIPPAWLLRLYGARPLAPYQAPQLHAILATLSRRAGVAVPALYYLPSRLMNAFSVGGGREAALTVSDGLLRGLGRRELAAVMAHELSHIRHNDTRVMGLADAVSRLTHVLSLLGQLLVLINLPLIVLGRAPFPWLGVLLLVLAPLLSALLQLALSRTREFDADLGAARITEDPAALASALTKLEQQERHWSRLLLPGQRNPSPSLLRTHPRTEERVER
ncbi:MAG TPA: zinc metalloprotease HtpX, partial [Gammaproteobacteria bacterium]|nr:zinc metalloprotease HtpX [Gammaproteobacteria bacterium]